MEDDERFSLSDVADRFLQTHDYSIIYDLLKRQYVGVEQIVVLVREKPRSIDEVSLFLKESIGTGGTSHRQIEIKLDWLRGLGYVVKFGRTYTISSRTVANVDRGVSRKQQHTAIKDMLIEIGKIKGFQVKREAVIREGRAKIDVLWMSKGQYAAWEVHLGANIHQALSFLKTALEWKSAVPFLVTTNEGEAKAKQLVETTFEALKDNIKFMQAESIKPWYEAVRGANEAEKGLGFRHRTMFRESTRAKMNKRE